MKGFNLDEFAKSLNLIPMFDEDEEEVMILLCATKYRLASMLTSNVISGEARDAFQEELRQIDRLIGKDEGQDQ